MGTRRTYTQLERDEAVRELQATMQADGLSAHAASTIIGQRLDVSPSTLRHWARTVKAQESPRKRLSLRAVQFTLGAAGVAVIGLIVADVYPRLTDRPGVSVTVLEGVTLDNERSQNTDDFGYQQPSMYVIPHDAGVTPDQAAQLIGTPAEFDKWAVEHDAIPAYRKNFRFRIQSENDQPVWIDGVRAELFVGNNFPSRGWFVNRYISECGDGLEKVVGARIYLQPETRDETEPLVDYVEWPTTAGGALRPLKATQDSPAFVDVTVDPGLWYAEYGIRIDYEVDGKPETYVLGTRNEPLKLTPVMPGYAESYARRLDEEGRPQREPDPGPNSPYLPC